jgi:hypothetical protein
MEWKPIETAPKDGAWILLAGGSIRYEWDGLDEPPAVAAQWTTLLNGSTVPGHWQFAWYDGGFYGEYEAPSLWMPIPPLSVESA